MADINSLDAIKVFFAHNVIVTWIGNSGEEEYELANLAVYTCRHCDMKGWVVARNLAGNVLVFNAIIPGCVPVHANPHKLKVTIGKVPSLSYTNAKGKAIPTIWTFQLSLFQEFKAFFGLLLLFTRLGKEVNANGIVNFMPPQENIIPTIAMATSTDNNDYSINLLESNDSTNDDEEISNNNNAVVDEDDKKINTPQKELATSKTDSFGSPCFCRKPGCLC